MKYKVKEQMLATKRLQKLMEQAGEKTENKEL